MGTQESRRTAALKLCMAFQFSDLLLRGAQCRGMRHFSCSSSSHRHVWFGRTHSKSGQADTPFIRLLLAKTKLSGLNTSLCWLWALAAETILNLVSRCCCSYSARHQSSCQSVFLRQFPECEYWCLGITLAEVLYLWGLRASGSQQHPGLMSFRACFIYPPCFSSHCQSQSWAQILGESHARAQGTCSWGFKCKLCKDFHKQHLYSAILWLIGCSIERCVVKQWRLWLYVAELNQPRGEEWGIMLSYSYTHCSDKITV